MPHVLTVFENLENGELNKVIQISGNEESVNKILDLIENFNTSKISTGQNKYGYSLLEFTDDDSDKKE